MNENQIIEKWTHWIEGPNAPIWLNVVDLHYRRDIYRGLSEIVREHGKLPPSSFWPYHLSIYLESQASAIRRQADKRKGVASLARLIDGVHRDNRRLTADWWVGLWDIKEPNPEAERYEREFARRRFEDEFGGKVGAHLDPAIPRADLERLATASESVTEFVNRHIAHTQDPDGPLHPRATPADEVVLSLTDIDDAIDMIGELFGRYHSLMLAADMTQVEPEIQHDWRAPFRVPWIRRDED